MTCNAAIDQPPEFDRLSFRKCMDKIGRAYRSQAIELIRICLLFAKGVGSVAQDTELTKLVQLCDDTLRKAAETKTTQHPASGNDFKRLTRIFGRHQSRLSSSDILSSDDFGTVVPGLIDYESSFHASGTVIDVRKRMMIAKEKDLQQRAKTNEDPWSTAVEVYFHIMKDLSHPQSIIVTQLLNHNTTLQEVLWNFIRLPETNRLTLSENPRFYNNLLVSSIADWRKLDVGPTEENWHTHRDHTRPICVLTNAKGRVFLEHSETLRAFDNVWKMNDILVFKGVDGKLEGESTVEASIQGDLHPCCHLEELSSHLAIGVTVDPSNSGAPPTNSPTCVSFKKWNVELRDRLHSPDIKILIKRCACTNPSDS